MARKTLTSASWKEEEKSLASGGSRVTPAGLRCGVASVSQVLPDLQQDLRSEIVIKFVFDHRALIPTPERK